MMLSFKHVAAHSRLAQQVKWQHPSLVQSGIDQRQLAVADAPTGAVPFSFVVMGDTDAGSDVEHSTASFSNAFVEQLMAQWEDSRFLLHTGDVTYPVGSYQNYFSGFLQPYRALLSALPESPAYKGNAITFARPLLTVPGNHDYAERVSGVRSWARLTRFVCDRLRQMGIDWGHYGGQGGEAYGQTFLDDLAVLSPDQLSAHLKTHYSAKVPSVGETKYGLNYRAGQFTRLPNRYYKFRYGGIDFFALDSNTWNTASTSEGFDHEQLAWLEKSLVQSCQSSEVGARIVYLHHSPYTTEETRWQQPEALWVRRHLRAVLDKVAIALGHSAGPKGEHPSASFLAPSSAPPSSGPLVNLVISGHAHCLEHLKTIDTGHADSHLDWLVCGGSGANLRRQRQADADILENLSRQGRRVTKVVAKSQLYAGVHGHGSKRQQFHSFVRVEWQPHQAQKLMICPYVVVRDRTGWQTKALNTWPVGVNTTQALIA